MSSPPDDRLKRALDLALAAAGLVVTAPALVLIALLVRKSSPGPVIFSQERVCLLYTSPSPRDRS